MYGSDVIVTGERNGKFTAVDYFRSGMHGCIYGKGVCADVSSVPPGNDDVTAVSGSRRGDIVHVNYTRLMGASDGTDLAFKKRYNIGNLGNWSVGSGTKFSPTAWQYE